MTLDEQRARELAEQIVQEFDGIVFKDDVERTIEILLPLIRDQGRYRELIMAVARKYPDETRHETALRYIMQAEAGDSRAGQDAAIDKARGET